MLQAEDALVGAKNHQAAVRMAIIAFINTNIVLACIYGTFSVLLSGVESRLGVGLKLATLGIPVVNLAIAICAPGVGVLASRASLRLLMLVGACLGVAGFLLLAVTHSYLFYLLAYGLLIGPGMAVGVILPGTLVTRWFAVNRGKALGLVNTPIGLAIMPLAINWMLQKHGLTASYLALAGLSVVSVVANLFILDKPPGYEPARAVAHGGVAGMGMAELVRAPRFWALLFAFIASSTSSVVLGAHMVPMARSWNLSATQGATMLATMSLVGIVGTLLYGWVADRLGGALSIAFVVLVPAVLWLLLLAHPPFVEAVGLVGLIGLNGAGVVPVFSYALSEAFGRESFSRAYGVANLINLPFSVACVPVAAVIFMRTGSYNGAIIAVALFLCATGLVALTARRRPPAVPVMVERFE
ncbi:MAG TPA: MFS transporter [Acidocella sp.]|jgi:MFS family permease|nr:MFS transporter [Acidocella sp.]